MISLNHNLTAQNTANTLTTNYGRLQTSVQRLSSGLRINGADDDAAGLAVRELMRTDIAALNQGVRNANDAISMIQTFDGALGVIDEKLIRMKELAEQAATGTYDSTQRLMIDSEFQAMGSEIDRIANATDFNGVKLLCTKMITWYEDVTKFRITDPGSFANLNISGGNNGNPVLSGANANNYVNEANPAKTINVSLTATAGTHTDSGQLSIDPTYTGAGTKYILGDTPYKASVVNPIGNAGPPNIKYDPQGNPPTPTEPLRPWSVDDGNGNRVYTPMSAPNGLTFQDMRDLGNMAVIGFSLEDATGTSMDLQNIDNKITEIQINTAPVDANGIPIAPNYSITRNTIEINANTADYTVSYKDYENGQTVTVRLTNGGTVSLALDNALNAGDTISFDIHFEGEVNTEPEERHGVDPNQRVKIHFGTMNDSAEDYYYIKYANCTREGLGIDDVKIQTQQEAQEALVRIDDAIVAKDKVRADLGALQNRFENTMTNLKTQAENLQAAESRISDTDIAIAMMTFVRDQILAQSATAMLAQANSMPQMVMALIS